MIDYKALDLTTDIHIKSSTTFNRQKVQDGLIELLMDRKF